MLQDILDSYLDTFHLLKKKSITLGIQYDSKTSSYFMGKKVAITFSDKHIFVGKGEFKITRGLLELLFKA